MTDEVNHPKHYNEHPSGVECIDIVRHMTFNVGNVFKYLWRAGLKDSEPSIKDHKKALFYLQDEIERLELAEREEDTAQKLVFDEARRQKTAKLFTESQFDRERLAIGEWPDLVPARSLGMITVVRYANDGARDEIRLEGSSDETVAEFLIRVKRFLPPALLSGDWQLFWYRPEFSQKSGYFATESKLGDLIRSDSARILYLGAI